MRANYVTSDITLLKSGVATHSRMWPIQICQTAQRKCNDSHTSQAMSEPPHPSAQAVSAISVQTKTSNQATSDKTNVAEAPMA
eukprot:1189419-Amphidinium_carterae.1